MSRRPQTIDRTTPACESVVADCLEPGCEWFNQPHAPRGRHRNADPLPRDVVDRARYHAARTGHRVRVRSTRVTIYRPKPAGVTS